MCHREQSVQVLRSLAWPYHNEGEAVKGNIAFAFAYLQCVVGAKGLTIIQQPMPILIETLLITMTPNLQNHHPLEFDEPAIQDLVTCASEWFNLAINEEKKQGGSNDLYPFLLWNCLARAGEICINDGFQSHIHRRIIGQSIPDIIVCI